MKNAANENGLWKMNQFHGAPPCDADYEKAMAGLGPAKWPDFF